MKFIPAFIIQIFISATLFSQSDPSCAVNDLLVKSKNGFNEIDFDYFNHRGNDNRVFGSGLLDSTHYWTWDEYYLLHQERSLYTHDTEGRMSSILRIEWDPDQWKTTYLQTFTYNEDGDVINRVFQYWDGSSFTNSRRDVYVYDPNKNLIEVLNQDWDADAWHSWARLAMEYDDQDNLITAESYGWNGMEWMGFHRDLYAYDQEDRVIQRISQVWDTAWTSTTQELYSYNANGVLEFTLQQGWWQDEWKTDSRIYNEFNSNHQIVKSIYQKPTFNDWFSQYQTLYSYDTIGNELGQLFQTKSQDKWHNKSRNTKAYDLFQNLVSEANQVWEEDEWVYTDSSFYYFPFISGTKDLDVTRLAIIYPNPVRSTLNLQFEEIDLHNAVLDIYFNTGIKVMQMDLTDQKTFALDVRKLVAGSYFLRIYSHGSYQVIPFLKQ